MRAVDWLAVTCGVHCDQTTCSGSDACSKCLPGYTGANCETAHTCSPHCADQSSCVEDGQCAQCAPHYHGPACSRLLSSLTIIGIQSLSAVNACSLGNGGCGTHSICSPTTAGKRTCKCIQNWRSPNGDGTQCYAIDPCLINNGGCGAPIKNICTYKAPGVNTCHCAWPYTSPTGRNCLLCMRLVAFLMAPCRQLGPALITPHYITFLFLLHR